MSGAQGPAVDELAAELIAADVAKTQLLERPAKVTAAALAVTERKGPRWIMIGGLGVVLIMLLGGGAVAIGSFGGALPGPTLPVVAAATATPAAESTATPTATSTATSTATAAPTATPTPAITIAPATPSPSPTLPPTPALPVLVTGDSLAYGEFIRASGSCPYADRFVAQFEFVAVDGVLTMIQLPGNHTTTGSLTRTGPSEAAFVTTAEGQSYEGTISGSTVQGSHRYTGEGCDDAWDFVLTLLRPFVAPPPAGTAPGHFEILNGRSFDQQLQLLPGRAPHLVVGSFGDPDMTTLLPIRVILYVGDQTPWNTVIEGDPSAVCRGPDGCSTDAPGPLDAAWLAPGQHPLLLAFAADGTLIAAHAQNGMPSDGLPPPYMPPP